MRMDDFDDIRPYRDDEIPVVLGRMLAQPEVLTGLAKLVCPRLHRAWPGAARMLVSRTMKRRTDGMASVRELQELLEPVARRLFERTIVDLTTSGMESLESGYAHLFMSNHRDISLDSTLLNFVLHEHGHDTCYLAVGDNLLTNPLAEDFLKLNKAFVVRRSVSGSKALFASMNTTSRFVRDALTSGDSVWIAQREGRAKDGLDRTEPAILKMLMLAFRKEVQTMGEWLQRVRLVPVSISYELDPCDRRKAHELFVAQRDGSFLKGDEDDFEAMLEGADGFKGRVHVHFGERVLGEFDDVEGVARAIDAQVVDGLRVFPTHALAASMSDIPVESPYAPIESVMGAFRERLAGCPPEERDYLLLQYANTVRNKQSLALGVEVEDEDSSELS